MKKGWMGGALKAPSFSVWSSLDFFIHAHQLNPEPVLQFSTLGKSARSTVLCGIASRV
jgi:hypothetical protein